MEIQRAEMDRLYTDLVWTWPIISPWQDYVEESENFLESIKASSSIPVRTLLNMGCGGGHNDKTLKKHLQVTGLDLSEGMLGLARSLNPECTYLHGDMRTIRLNQEFDAVVVFDSLAHMLSDEDLKSAFGTAFSHLKPGGVFCTYREFAPERFIQNETKTSVQRNGGVEIVLIENYYDPDRHDSTFESTMLYLIRRDSELNIETQSGLVGLFPLEIWTGLLTEVGFDVLRCDLDPYGCDFFVCLKPVGG